MNLYIVNIGRRLAPRLSFCVMAESVARAQEQHDDLCEPLERCEASPVVIFDPQAADAVDALRRGEAL